MKKILATIFSIAMLASAVSTVYAQGLINTDTASSFASEVKQEAGFTQVSIGDIVANVIKASLSLLAVIFVVLIVLSGFRWMTSQGNEEMVKEAQSTIKTALIGLIIVLAAWGITYFVFKYLPFSGTGMGPQGGTSG